MTGLIRLLLFCLFFISCSGPQTLLQREYRSPQDFLADYLKIPKLAEHLEMPELASDQKNYTLEFVEAQLPENVSFVLGREWKVDSEGKLSFVVQKNNDYENLAAEALILKEFIDSLFAFTDSPEQGLDFYTRLLSGDILTIEEHLRRRIRNIDFQPAATFLDDFYQSTYLPSLRKSLTFTPRWKRFEEAKQDVNETNVLWGEVVTSWLNRNNLQKITQITQQENLSQSLSFYFEQMTEIASNEKAEKVLMFFPLNDESKDAVDLVAEGMRDIDNFSISPNEGPVDLAKSHSEWGLKTFFISLYTSIDDASKKGAAGVAGVLVEKKLLLPQNQGLFAQNVWLYPIGVRKSQIVFKAGLKELRLSKGEKNRSRLNYFIPAQKIPPQMIEYKSREEFQNQARVFYLNFYEQILKTES